LFIKLFTKQCHEQKTQVIRRAPSFSGFKPFGVQKATSCEVKLSFEEYEAMKYVIMRC